MRFGHYTVFDTPEENKHTQVYVEYDVPNNDDLEGATGTIVLTEGGQGSGGGDAGNGIRSITISPAITTTPALESLFPVYWNGETQQIEISAFGMGSGDYTVTITPTADTYAFTDEGEDGVTSDTKGAPITFETTAAKLQRGYPLAVLDDPTDFETFKIVATLKFTPNE